MRHNIIDGIWCVVDKTNNVFLCDDRAHAIRCAGDCDSGFPSDAPHKAVMLGDVQAERWPELTAAYEELSARMKRRNAYAWMQELMGMTAEQAHISRMNSEQCQKLILMISGDQPSALVV